MTASSKRQKREEYRKTHREEGGSTELPKKKFYRQRAHANPFSDHQLTYPVSPSHMDWSPYYPAFVDPSASEKATEGQPKPLRKQVTVADIGCGFGGLLVALAPMLPDELILGLEIRTQVTEYVQDRITALRAQHGWPARKERITFPHWTVAEDSYYPLPSPTSKTMKQFVIAAPEGSSEEIIKATTARLGPLIDLDEIPIYVDQEGRQTYWVAYLTPRHAAEIREVEGVQSVLENQITDYDLAQGMTPSYCDTNTHQLSKTKAPTPYQNISVLRANTMKFLPNFFHKAQLTHIFLCFPDPHFKARKHKQRIVSSTLCAEYAYVLRPGGCVYTITDVKDVGDWMRERFAEFGGGQVFERVEVPEEGMEKEWIDSCGDENGKVGEETAAKREVGRMVRAIREETEEGKKVIRNGGDKYVGVWRRRENPPWPDEQ